ncbi:GTPase [Candidatus Accumulibacter necessarius]|jgi:hypothetical protein|uniref:GTPase n=1 Tax=Candidatus Accumulibacter necessarius TaxID=2954386 RepID=UPI003DA9094D
MAAFADGNKDESERAELKRIADALAGEGSINIAALYQDVLLKRVSMPAAAAALTTPRRANSPSKWRSASATPTACNRLPNSLSRRAARRPGARRAAGQAPTAAGGSDRRTAGGGSQRQRAPTTAARPAPPCQATAAGYASTMSEAEMDQAILNAAILNGALELLPESLSTMAIIPLQMKLVYRIGKSYGFELDRGHIKDFLATLGVGLTSQYLEQAGRKLLGGLLGKVGGGLLGGLGQAGGQLGNELRQHLRARPRRQTLLRRRPQLLDADAARSFDNVLGEAKGLQSRYLPEMQARARTLDTAQIVDLVRQG